MTGLLLLACLGDPSLELPEGDADTDADSDTDTDTDTDADADTDVADPVIFSVMGDIPYGEDEIPILDEHVALHNEHSPSLFMVHLGDIKAQSDPCDEEAYTQVAAQLKALDVPTFMVVGDNEWNDCPDPNAAWALWTASFLDLYGDMEGVTTQPGRPENFAFVRSKAVFVGFTMPGGAVHDEAAWADFLADGAEWVEQQLQDNDQAQAAVLFTHAKPGSNHDAFMTPFLAAAKEFGRPVLFLHGDGHQWIHDEPWNEAPQVTRIQVEAGADAVPLQVTVDFDDDPTWVLEREAF